MVSSVAFSPDATLAITGSFDGTARVWEVVGLRERLGRLRSVRELLAFAEPRVGRGFTDEERKRFLSD